jgi:hypothetical protein
MLIELSGVGSRSRLQKPPRVGGAAEQMERFHPAIELFLGDNDNRPAALPCHMKRRAAIANLIHVGGEPLAEIAIGDVAWFGLFRPTVFAMAD